jgi:iron(III) transport system substrate-binding protein
VPPLFSTPLMRTRYPIGDTIGTQRQVQEERRTKVGRSIVPVRRAVFVLVALALLGVSVAAATASQGASSGIAAKAPAKKWKQIVAAAKKEGKVVLYTAQNPVLLANMANDFKKKYGISVTINRNIDNLLASQIDNEFKSNNHTADVS